MSEVKWIKITTDIFDDEKIKMIEIMPEADTIIVCWFKLLTLCGKINQGGRVRFNINIPFTDEMLASIFNRPLKTVQLAIKTFEAYGMIEIEGDHTIMITNWEKHQNVIGMDKIREQNAERQRRYREKQKKIENSKKTEQITDSNVTHNVISNAENNVTSQVLDIDIDIDKELDKDINIYIQKIVDNYNLTEGERLTILQAIKSNGNKVEYLKKSIDYMQQQGKDIKSDFGYLVKMLKEQWDLTAKPKQCKKQYKTKFHNFDMDGNGQYSAENLNKLMRSQRR